MPTYAELASQLLEDAAGFFETIGEQNEPLREQMMQNAAVFREVGAGVKSNPLEEIAMPVHNHSHEGGCCGGHGHHHHGHDHDHGHAHGHDADDEKGNCDSKGGCGCH